MIQLDDACISRTVFTARQTATTRHISVRQNIAVSHVIVPRRMRHVTAVARIATEAVIANIAQIEDSVRVPRAEIAPEVGVTGMVTRVRRARRRRHTAVSEAARHRAGRRSSSIKGERVCLLYAHRMLHCTQTCRNMYVRTARACAYPDKQTVIGATLKCSSQF